jgi:DNA helicase-2/ATP-dependent DNA helicase PcrA
MNGTYPDYLEHLNSEQRRAVVHTGSPLLILAGAGSGKTRVITYKIAYLIRELGIDPYSILAVTFTNKAANEMRERAATLAEGAAKVMIRTFHSFGAWLLRRNAALLDMAKRFTIYDDDDSRNLLKAIYPDLPKRLLATYARGISRAKDYCLTPEHDLYAVSPDPDLPRVYAEYQNRLQDIGNADFGDLIMRCVELLRDNPAVLERVRSRFTHILVDEYQDSNVAQHELLKHLVGPDTYICVVGDDDQSIYRFRGAEVRNILTFDESFEDATVIRLEQNYRSTGRILDVAGSVVAGNVGRLGKQLWTENDVGAKPSLLMLYDQDAEVDFCVRLVRSAPARARDLSETAILYRTNAQSRLFETAFLREGIPYRIVGTLRFWEREEIKDAVAFLKFMANTRDEISFRRIVNKPSRGIGPTTVNRIAALLPDSGGDMLQACRLAVGTLSNRASKAVRSFVEVVDRTEAAFGDQSLATVVELVLEESGLYTYHESQDDVAGSQKVQNLEELVNAASLYPATEDGLAEFLESIELDSARQSSEENGVTLITMHNTKGLEFDRVIITGLEEGLFPRSDDLAPDDLEEERRLFYVAVTRARRELYLTTCRYRRIHGKTLQLAPSRFLEEIPTEQLEIDDSLEASSSLGMNRPGRPGVDGPDDAPELEPGVYVYSDAYGTGVVCKKWQTDKATMVMVRFETGRVAKLFPKYTTLEKISPESV